MITVDQLRRATGADQANASRWLDAINSTMVRFEINTPQRVAHFLPQLAHESMSLARTRENFNYSPDGLRNTFNSRRKERFSLALAYQLGRVAGHHRANEEAIANIAYGDREELGNRGQKSGDGYKYCGRGLIQLTGRANYERAGRDLGYDYLEYPELVEMSPHGALIAGWFWNQGNRTGKSLNALADAGDVVGISQAINGGTNGIVARQELTHLAMRVFRGVELVA